MAFEEQFELDFMKRTLKLVKQYKGPYDATLLLNCLLGLLIVPKESSIDKIPYDPISNISKWGISPNSIKSFGAATNRNPKPDTLRGIIWNLRNALCHSHFKPIHKNRQVNGFEFSDNTGFKAVIDIKEICCFVETLANYLVKQFVF